MIVEGRFLRDRPIFLQLGSLRGYRKVEARLGLDMRTRCTSLARRFRSRGSKLEAFPALLPPCHSPQRREIHSGHPSPPAKDHSEQYA